MARNVRGFNVADANHLHKRIQGWLTDAACMFFLGRLSSQVRVHFAKQIAAYSLFKSVTIAVLWLVPSHPPLEEVWQLLACLAISVLTEVVVIMIVLVVRRIRVWWTCVVDIALLIKLKKMYVILRFIFIITCANNLVLFIMKLH